MTKELIRRYRFFFDHAGYVVGQRAVCALSLARAEQHDGTPTGNAPGSRDQFPTCLGCLSGS